MRNPWDRIVSIYSKRKYHEWAGFPRAESFSDWIDAEMSKGPWVFDQRKYIQDQGLDFVSRFENIDEDFSFFCSKIGLPEIKLPHVNGFPHAHYRKFYDKKLIDKLLNYSTFREDLDYLGYDHKP